MSEGSYSYGSFQQQAASGWGSAFNFELLLEHSTAKPTYAEIQAEIDKWKQSMVLKPIDLGGSVVVGSPLKVINAGDTFTFQGVTYGYDDVIFGPPGYTGPGFITQLQGVIPGLANSARCPCCDNESEIWRIIIHLNDGVSNDGVGWTREQIADWLDTLDTDLQFKLPDSPEKTEGSTV